ncbi:DoxX family protein [Pseudonocardiaceae bacterium YIM PH 21723]|nr:DoxX family protein [Pseudonocardiaceae bacterium YIM PH 21723]
MFIAHLIVTLLASALTGAAAIANLIGHEYPRRQADIMRVPHSWMRPLGALLAAGSVGLLAGLAVPIIGLLAAGGLVLYFLGALVAHVRVGDRNLGPWSVFFLPALACLILGW